MSTILEIATVDRNLSSLMKALNATTIEELLKGAGPFTLLAPINMAFGNLTPPLTLDSLINPLNNARLSDILSFHILKEKRLSKNFRNGQVLQTIHGNELNVTVKDGEIRINGAKILTRDRQGFNGVIHSIDAVNIPSEAVKPLLNAVV